MASLYLNERVAVDMKKTRLLREDDGQESEAKKSQADDKRREGREIQT